MNLVLQLIKPKTEFETVLTEFPSITQPNTLDHPIKHNVTQHVDVPLRNLKLLIRSLNIRYNWVSSSTHLATGPHLLIWFPKRYQGIGDIVETRKPSILSPFPTVIPSCTFMIFLLPYKDLLYFLKLISSKLTTLYQYTQAIYPKPQFPPPLDYSNLLICPLVSETQHKLFKDSLTRSFKDFTLHKHIFMMYL